MIRGVFACVLASSIVMFAAACGGGNPGNEPAPVAPAAPAAPAPPKPAGSVSLLEPADGAMGGHIDTFRWAPVAGADGYVIKIQASDGRVVWESAPLTATETKLPASVALEPEVHTWSVSARKGAEVLATSAMQKFTITP